MKLSGPISEEMVWRNGRGNARLLDVMAEAGVPYQEVDFPQRRYHKFGGLILICGGHERPYERIELVIPDQNYEPEGKARVASREPIPFVEVYGDLYEYERGELLTGSKRRKEREAAFPRGHKIFEVLGRATPGKVAA
jgi:hypothetical protein